MASRGKATDRKVTRRNGMGGSEGEGNGYRHGLTDVSSREEIVSVELR